MEHGALARRVARRHDGWPDAIPAAPMDSIRFRRAGTGTIYDNSSADRNWPQLLNAETVHPRHRPELRRDLRVAGDVSAAQEDAARSASSSSKSPRTFRHPGARGAAGAGGRRAADATRRRSKPRRLVAAAAEQDVVVENAFVKAVFNTRAAVLKSWRLKNYRDGERCAARAHPAERSRIRRSPFTLDVDDASDVGDVAERALQAGRRSR